VSSIRCSKCSHDVPANTRRCPICLNDLTSLMPKTAPHRAETDQSSSVGETSSEKVDTAGAPGSANTTRHSSASYECPLCYSTDLTPSGKSILDGKLKFRCNACNIQLAPLRSRAFLIGVLGLGFFVILTCIAVLVFLSAGKVRVGPRSYLSLVVGIIASAIAIVASVRELRRPMPVRKIIESS
jgi:hypothetical protein